MDKNSLTPEQIMRVSPVIPVIAIDDVHQALDLAKALIAGGISILEITLRTPAALEAIHLLSDMMPEAVVGAGTVLNKDDLMRVKEAGASFAISPGSTRKLLKKANKMEFPLLPGVATGSEVMQGLELGYTHFKLFPAVAVGGIQNLKSFAGPFKDAKFCPTGGVNETNFTEFLALNNVLCIGGSWVASNALVREGRFDEITKLTKKALEIIKQTN